MNEKTSNVRVVRTWRNNQTSNTMLLSIPHEMAKEYNLDEPTNILVIPTDHGILIRRLHAGGSLYE
ncbi:MAG: hypothetical protein M3P28_03620 [Thermoproteota archaeon]|nr:hypothetical protein [Thermoproteota archaeon]